MEDLITVVVPIYKLEKYLKKCIDSIIKQTYKNLEIILVDDGSPDKCPQICDEYVKKDSRIKVIHKKNGGVSSARNLGIKSANGIWIAFIDADDWIEEKYFEELIYNAKENGAEVSLCGYNRVVNSERKEKILNSKSEILNSKEYLIKALNPQTGYGFVHLKIIRRDIIKDVQFNQNLVVGEDALFNVAIAPNINKAIYCNKALYNYRINSESVVKKFDNNYAKKYLRSMQECKKYILETYKDDKQIIQNYYNYVGFHVMLVAVNFCYHPDNKIKNRRKLLKEVCNYPEFKEGIRKSNYENLSLTRKITLFTLKNKLYFFTSIICKIRQKQNQSKGKR